MEEKNSKRLAARAASIGGTKLPQSPTNWLYKFIKKATGAPDKDIALIEDVSRL